MKSNIKKLFLSLIIAIFFLLLIESSLRIVYGYKHKESNAGTTWWRYSDILGWERRPNYSGHFYRCYRKFDENGFFVEDTDQTIENGKLKIIALGDSCTLGNGVKTENIYTEKLDGLLPDHDVINLGVSGYTSHQGYKTLINKGIKLKPSVVIVSFNFNDRRYVLKQEEIDKQRFQKKSFLNKFAGNLLLIKGIRKYAIPKLKNKIHIDNLFVRVSPEQYRKNLIQIVKASNENNIRVIFVKLRDNPRDQESFINGLQYFNSSKYELASQKFLISLRNDSKWFRDLARKYLAKIYKIKSISVKANKSLVFVNNPRISLHGGFPIFTDIEYNRIMSEVAQEYNVEVVDAGIALHKKPQCLF